MILLRGPMLLGVLFYQSLMLALSQIWSNKMRSVLTMLGIVIGVASVTAIIAALSGLKGKVLADLENFGTNKIFIGPDWPRNAAGRANWTRVLFKPQLFDGMLEHCPSLKYFTRITGHRQTVKYAEKSEEQVDVIGIEPDWHAIESRPVRHGRPFSVVDNAQARPVCLVDSKLQQKLELDQDCTGESVLIGSRRFLIIGVLEDKPRMEMGFNTGESDAQIWVPFNTAYAHKTGWFRGMHVVAASQAPNLSEEAKGEITFFLRKKRGIAIGEEDTFFVEFVEQFVQQFNRVALAITLVATGVVGISLLVGGVGIMNIMLVSVSERTREIGLRKAVGARPSAILLQFLVEAVTLCLLGGLIGLAIGKVIVWGFTRIPGAQLERAAIPTWAVALAFGFSAMVGLIFGMFPAIKAARLDPIEALRHE